MSTVIQVPPMSPADEEMLAGMYPKASPHHIKALWHFAAKKGLDPVTRQITMTLHWDKDAKVYTAAFITTIDAMRLKAASTGAYAGSDDYEYEELQGASKPVKARCTVYRLAGGQRCPFTSTVRWAEFAGTGRMWTQMAFHMLGKCAEAQALRKGFPEELSGLYIQEEMDQAEEPAGREDAPKSAAALNERAKEIPPPPPPEEEEPVNPRVATALAYFAKIGKDEAAVLKHLGHKTTREITQEDLDERLYAWAEELKREEQANARNAK